MNSGSAIHAVDQYHMLIAGISKIKTDDAGKFVDSLRKVAGGIFVQAVNSDIVYGTEHVKKILEITLESQKRNIMIANRPETDLLMRLACTSQFSVALERAGIKNNSSASLVLFSKKSNELTKLYDRLKTEFGLKDDMSVLEPNDVKRNRISAFLEIPSRSIRKQEFLDYLVERAAIIH